MNALIRRALLIALTIGGFENKNEIHSALAAISKKDPAAEFRAKKALSRGLAARQEKGLPTPSHAEAVFNKVISLSDEPSPLVDQTKSAHIHLRIEESRKAAYMAAAKKSSMSLSQWLISQADKAADV